MKIFVYPGSFDPFTNGHLDIAERALKLCDHLIIAIAVNSAKKSLFTVAERQELIEQSLYDWSNATLKNAKLVSDKKIEVRSFEGLLVDFVKKNKAHAVVRGIRAVTDFDYEYAMYQLNNDLEPSFETIFLLASKNYSFLSSTMLKEVARYGRSVEGHAPAVVNRALLRKFEEFRVSGS